MWQSEIFAEEFNKRYAEYELDGAGVCWEIIEGMEHDGYSVRDRLNGEHCGIPEIVTGKIHFADGTNKAKCEGEGMLRFPDDSWAVLLYDYRAKTAPAMREYSLYPLPADDESALSIAERIERLYRTEKHRCCDEDQRAVFLGVVRGLSVDPRWMKDHVPPYREYGYSDAVRWETKFNPETHECIWLEDWSVILPEYIIDSTGRCTDVSMHAFTSL